MLFIFIEEIELAGGHIEVILFIEIETLEFDYGRPYWNNAIYRDCQIRLTGGHIKIMLFIEIENLEIPGGHIEIMLFIKMEKK